MTFHLNRRLPRRRPPLAPGLARRKNLRDACIAAVLVLGVSTVPAPSQASTAANGITIMLFGNDRWYNYDFNSTGAQSNNVDWPVTLLFTGNATINKTKSKMDSWTTYDSGSPESKHLKLSDNVDSAWGWDADGGKKTIACPGPGSQARHYRVYSTSNGGQERLYNGTLGYYVVATTHSDFNECPPIGKYHADSEAVEMNIANQTDDNTAVNRDRWGLHNTEPWRVEGNHRWDNNGWATTINIP